MTKEPDFAGSPTGLLTILSISPIEEDHQYLQAIVDHENWMYLEVSNRASALALLRRNEIPVVLCERDLVPGTWMDVLEHINTLPNAASLIVTSRLADERLWCEALNLNAWDVLAKPFDRNEVIRSVASGWQHWHDHNHMRAKAVKAAAVN